jgi:hypothetical protein
MQSIIWGEADFETSDYITFLVCCCPNLTSLTILSSFIRNDGLTNIATSNFLRKFLEIIIFLGCTKLETIQIFNDMSITEQSMSLVYKVKLFTSLFG